MRLLAWVDGSVVEASALRLQTPYVMQRIHTLEGIAYNLEGHIDVLRRESECKFGFASVIGVKDAQRIIGRLLELSHVGNSLSVPVVMRLDASASLTFEVENPTFGCGGYLRAKRDVGVVLKMQAPCSVAQTSVSVALDAMANCQVNSLGGNSAVWVDGEDKLISRPWCPVFVCYKGSWFTPTEYESVEYGVAVRAIEKAGQRVYVRDIPESALELVDEMFVADIMGITSYASIKKHRLLSSLTTRVALMMEPKI